MEYCSVYNTSNKLCHGFNLNMDLCIECGSLFIIPYCSHALKIQNEKLELKLQ